MVHLDRWSDAELVQFAKTNKKRGEKATAALGKKILEDANWTNQVYEVGYARKFTAMSANAISDDELRANAKADVSTAAASDFVGALGINRPRENVSSDEWDSIFAELKARRLGEFRRERRVCLDRGAAVVSTPDAIRAQDSRLEKSVLRVVRVNKTAFRKLQYASDDRDDQSEKVWKDVVAAIALDVMMHDSAHATIACVYETDCVIIQRTFPAEDLHNARIDLQQIRFARSVCLRLLSLSALSDVLVDDRLTATAEAEGAPPKKERPNQFPSANHEGTA